MKAPLSTNHLLLVVSSMRTLSLAVVHSVHAEWLRFDTLSLLPQGMDLQGRMGGGRPGSVAFTQLFDHSACVGWNPM